MANQEVYMDIPALLTMAKNFDQRGQTPQRVAKTLEDLSNVVKGTAFMGLVGGMALARVIDFVRPFVERTAEKYVEISSDLTTSVRAYEAGDEQGATRFY